MRTSEAVFSEPLILKPGETRGSRPLQILGSQIWIKLAGADTNGNYAIMETMTQPQSGPPLHRHSRQEESFYILDGDFVFEVDGKRIPAAPGSSVFVPRGTAHAFRNVGNTAGRMLVTVQPAGLDDFLTELSDSTDEQGEPNMSIAIPIARRHGLELLGPPLDDRLT
jgi:quercetin dioxygenase-like cupin family protein